jgi:predicted aspartyl protease
MFTTALLTEQVGIAVEFRIHIREVLGSNIVRDTGYSGYFVVPKSL